MLPRISRVVAGLAMTLVVVGPLPTHAEPGGAPAPLDEATFLSRVRARSPRHAVLAARDRAASAAIDAAAPLPNPTLSYEREAVPSLDTSDDFVRLAWPLDLGGRRGLARDAARAGSAAEHASVARDRWTYELDAREAYLAAVYARALVARFDQARAELAPIVETLRSRASRGDASEYDAERAALELDTLDDERADAQRMLDTARLALGAFVGEPATAYDASGALSLPAAAAESATATRPDVDAARARAKQAEREATAAGRTWVPRLELMGGLVASSTGGDQGIGYVVGVGGELPIFDRGGAKAARSRAEATRWAREADALAAEAAADIARARRELAMRIAQAEAHAAGPAKRVTDLQRRALVTYREGDRPILELLDVQRQTRNTLVRGLELVHAARRAELALHRALGRTP